LPPGSSSPSRIPATARGPCGPRAPALAYHAGAVVGAWGIGRRDDLHAIAGLLADGVDHRSRVTDLDQRDANARPAGDRERQRAVVLEQHDGARRRPERDGGPHLDPRGRGDDGADHADARCVGEPRGVLGIGRDAVDAREIGDALRFRHHRAREMQLAAQDVLEQPPVGMGRDAAHLIARRHDGGEPGARDRLGEGRQIDLAQLALGHGGRSRAAARQAGPRIAGGRGHDSRSVALPPLESRDRHDAHLAHQVGVLAEGLFDAAAARIARHFERRAEHRLHALRTQRRGGGRIGAEHERTVPRRGERDGGGQRAGRRPGRGDAQDVFEILPAHRARRVIGRECRHRHERREQRGMCEGMPHRRGMHLWQDALESVVAVPFFILAHIR